MRDKCVCEHPKLAHLQEQRTSVNGEIEYIEFCCYCACQKFEPLELPAPAPTPCDDEDFTGRPA